VTVCSICGGTSFKDREILWDLLVAQWQLTPAERVYVDRQQGTSCTACGANLRSIALSTAICTALRTPKTLEEFVVSPEAVSLSLLEINHAGSLNTVLGKLPGHRLAEYPDIDIHALPFAAQTFDMVVHSDTLEHVKQPVRGLSECRRVLKTGGWLCFTIPTIIGRLTRSRTGLEKSFHGNPDTTPDDFLVHTEFGADMWTYVLQAGFSTVTLTSVDFPAALALSAQND
jgi:SAM-dependent methyltransferase